MSAAVAPGPAAAAGPPTPEPQRLLALLQLEARARRAGSLEELRFLIANETRRLIDYEQALVFSRSKSRGVRLETASGVTLVDRNAPFVRWAERISREQAIPASDARADDAAGSPRPLSRADVATEARADWDEFSSDHVLWQALRAPDGEPLGALWLGRATPFHEGDATLVARLGETYSHAWHALAPARRSGWRAPSRRARFAVAGLLLLLGFLPVHLSALAPAEVVAREPFVVAAPLDGVIDEIMVRPNARVQEGAPLFRFEDTALRNQLAVAEESLQVTLAALRTASQGAFGDEERNAEVALLRAQARLREAERDFAGELLERVVVRAPRAGLVLYSDESDWLGRPVSTGERVMLLADPSDLAVRIDLPVEDALVLEPGARASLFLDAAPMRAIEARIEFVAHLAEPTPAGPLAYRVDATLVDALERDGPRLRIGLQGTARVQGEQRSLAFTLFRRPLAAARQWLGW